MRNRQGATTRVTAVAQTLTHEDVLPASVVHRHRTNAQPVLGVHHPEPVPLAKYLTHGLVRRDLVMRQGEVYWLRFRGAGSEPEGRRPAVVLQDDAFNRSAIQTTVVAAITSNLSLMGMPGNVRLRKGEAGLPKPSVVNLSQIRTIDRSRLDRRIGCLGPVRVREVLRGLVTVFGIDEEHLFLQE